MAIPTRWKLAGATAAFTGLSLGGLMSLAQADDGGSADPITLRDERSIALAAQPVGVQPTTTLADLASPDGLSGSDFRASTTAPGVFDRTYDVAQDPHVSTNQRMAAITQLFYATNWMHDWYYDAGFTEAWGNGQKSNYGRGGLQNDDMRVEAQDYSGLNNANMSTPSDGARSRMQMYVFSLGSTSVRLTISTPPSSSGLTTSSTPAALRRRAPSQVEARAISRRPGARCRAVMATASAALSSGRVMTSARARSSAAFASSSELLASP